MTTLYHHRSCFSHYTHALSHKPPAARHVMSGVLDGTIAALKNLTPACISRDNDITGVLDHTFCVEHNAYGEIIQHELKPNGKGIPVTEDTKKEYVR